MTANLDEFDLPKKIALHLKDKTEFKQELDKGKTAQEILEISQETMAKFYGAAYHLFEHKHYQSAADGFVFLVTLNGHNYDYWLGLGMSEQLCGHYEDAIDAYEIAAIIEIENPISYFYLAKCLFAIHDRESSMLALDLAIEYAENRPEFFDLEQQAKAAKKLLIQDHF